ncbi:ATP-binding cassette domain-containing protein [bacterium]|nr:ATP-binding cassette domain-containing protein [bacterium]
MECRILDIDGLRLSAHKAFGKDKLQDAGVKLSLNAGEIAIAVGLNGVGKTELLAAAAGNVRSDGCISISGAKAGSPEAKRLVGYVPASESLYDELTCLEYLSAFAEIYGVERHYRPYIIREALASVHLEALEDTLIGDIKDKYRRRCLCLARALVHDPRLLVIDEVFEHVDNLELRSFTDILNGIRCRGKALLLSGRQLGCLSDLADQVCYLENGQPFLQGRIADIADELANHHLFQLQYIIKPYVNGSVRLRFDRISEDKRVISVRRNVQDSTLIRIMFRGETEDFNAWLAEMQSLGCQIVSCWEDHAFFGHAV